MSEMILLGAGASVEAKVPDTFGMTKKIAELFRQDFALERHAHVVAFVVGGLLFQRGIRNEDPLNCGVNVEDLFNAVQLLAERESLEAAPFVGSWHSMVQEFDKVSASPPHLDRLNRLIYENVTKEILGALPHNPPFFGGRNIDRELEKAIKTTVDAMVKNRSSSYTSSRVGQEVGEYVVKIIKDWLDKLRHRQPSGGFAFEREFRDAVARMKEQPGVGEIFAETAEAMIQRLIEIVWIDDPVRVEHLKPLLGLAQAQTRLTIATLNYDNGMELLARANAVPCNTGIDEWSKTGSFGPGDTGVFLLKLHGSIDWSLQRNQRSTERPMPHSIISQVDPAAKKDGFRPAVIFGQRNKLTAEGPFLDLLRAFQQQLSQSTSLTVVGYSFRDAHVNEYISQWLNQDANHRLQVIDPGFSPNQSDYAKALHAFCNSRLKIVSKPAGEGLKECFSA